MSALSKDIDAKYLELVQGFQEIFIDGEAANLKRYHRFGELFSDFCLGITTKKWGSRTVDTLVDDLKANGLLSTLKDPKRFMYWAKNVYDTYPDFKALESLAHKGFTVTHAKLLFSVESELLPGVTEQLIENDKVVSTRELETIIGGFSKTAALERIQQVVGESAPIAADAPVVAAHTAPAAPTSSAAPAAKDDKSERDDKDDKPAKDKKDSAVGGDAAAHPLKTIKQVEKTASKLLATIPDAFIAVRAASKTGFDSDKAQKNYNTELANLKSSLNGMLEPIAALLKEIEDCAAE